MADGNRQVGRELPFSGSRRMNEYTEAFERLVDWHQTRIAERDEFIKAKNDTLKAECLAAWKARFPRRKFDMARSKEENGASHSAIYERLSAGVKEYTDDWYAEEKQVKWALDMLAQKADIPVSTEWNCAYSVTDNDYLSMGFGAEKYAKESAESHLRDFQIHVPEAKVEHEFHPFDYPVHCAGGGISRGWHEWRVMVPTTEIGVAILKRKPGESLRDFVKACWKKGVNPRVYCPFLPVGYEEKMGLDFFGNEKAA